MYTSRTQLETTYTKQSFTTAQTEFQKTSKDMLKDISLKLEQNVLALCEAVLRRTQWNEETPETGKRRFGPAGTKLKSMVQEKQEYLAKLGAIAKAAEEVTMMPGEKKGGLASHACVWKQASSLGKLIRLVDFMSVESLVLNVQDSLGAMLYHMDNPYEEVRDVRE